VATAAHLEVLELPQPALRLRVRVAAAEPKPEEAAVPPRLPHDEVSLISSISSIFFL
jgi:hypothetical protein